MTQERFDYEVTRHLQGNKMEAKIMRITPSMAQTLLEKNITNRPLSSVTVDSYVGLIQRGAWKLNGEAIKISSSGHLIDGQHRLSAIVKSGIAIQTIVITGLEEEVFDTLDQGKRRGMSDILSIKGEANALRLASALRVICTFKENPKNPHVAGSIPVDIMEEFLMLNPSVRDYVRKASKAAHVCEHSIIASTWFMFAQKDEHYADFFFEALGDGANLSKKSPIRFLRDRLLMNKVASKKIARKEIFALIIKAWNSFRLGKEIGVLRWSEGEAFPTIM